MDNILEINKIYKESKKTIDEKHTDIAKNVLFEIEEFVDGRIGYYKKAIEYCAKQGSSMYIIRHDDAEINHETTIICNKYNSVFSPKVKNAIIVLIYRRLYKMYGQYYFVELKEDSVVIRWDKVKTNKWWIRNYFTEDWSDVFIYCMFALLLTMFCGFIVEAFSGIFFGLVLFVGLIISLFIIIKHIYQKTMLSKKVKSGEFFQSIVDEKYKQINKTILEKDYLFKKTAEPFSFSIL